MEGIEGSSDRRDLLEHWMNHRRRELRIKWTEVARRAGMSVQNVLRIRKGQISISEDAADGVEDALQWARGSVQRVIQEGAPPIPVAPVAGSTQGAPLSPEATQLFEDIEKLFKAWGLPMTPRMLEVWHDEIGRQLAARRRPESAPDAESVESSEDS